MVTCSLTPFYSYSFSSAAPWIMSETAKRMHPFAYRRSLIGVALESTVILLFPLHGPKYECFQQVVWSGRRLVGGQP